MKAPILLTPLLLAALSAAATDLHADETAATKTAPLTTTPNPHPPVELSDLALRFNKSVSFDFEPRFPAPGAGITQ